MVKKDLFYILDDLKHICDRSLISPEFLLRRLREKDCLVDIECHYIRNEGLPRKQINRIFDTIKAKSDTVFEEIMKIAFECQWKEVFDFVQHSLNEMNYEYSLPKLDFESGGNVITEQLRDILDSMKVVFVDSPIDPVQLYDQFRLKNIFTRDEVYLIESQVTPAQKINVLFDLLKPKPDTIFEEILKTAHEYQWNKVVELVRHRLKAIDCLHLIAKVESCKDVKQCPLSYAMLKFALKLVDRKTWMHYKDDDKNEELGGGSFGVVRLCRDPDTGTCYAVKHVRIVNKMTTDEVRELDICKDVQHKNIVKYFVEYFAVTKHDLYIVMEYMQGGSLKKKIIEKGKLDEKLVVHFTEQILEGVSYLHEQNIIHRDIKNENVLLDLNENVKLCDFGYSKRLEVINGKSNQCNTRSKGSLSFMAPEVFNGGDYGRRADIWSVGCAIVEMLTGSPPSAQRGLRDWYKWLTSTDENALEKSDLPDNVSTNMEVFLNSLFWRDPERRPTAIIALSDQLFQKMN